MDLQPVITAERRRVAELLGSLSPAQLAAPSLRAAWTVERLGPVALRRRRFSTGIRTCAALHIHGQDLRRALGLPHGLPLDQLRVVLDHLTGGRAWGLAPRRRIAGLRFEATDLDWAAGAGPVLAGPAEALMMAIAGRAAVLGELDGPGVPVLRARLAAGDRG